MVWQAKGAQADEEFDGRALTDESGQALVSHPGGAFRFEGLRIGEGEQVPYTFRVRAAGFEQLVRRGVPLGHGEHVDLGDLELIPAASLRVRVVEAGTDLPVEGARVFLAAAPDRDTLGRWRLWDRPAHSSDKVRFAESDAEGRAVLQLPTRRPWVLFANADGFPVGEVLDERRRGVRRRAARGTTPPRRWPTARGIRLGVEVSLRVSQSQRGNLRSPSHGHLGRGRDRTLRTHRDGQGGGPCGAPTNAPAAAPGVGGGRRGGRHSILRRGQGAAGDAGLRRTSGSRARRWCRAPGRTHPARGPRGEGPDPPGDHVHHAPGHRGLQRRVLPAGDSDRLLPGR